VDNQAAATLKVHFPRDLLLRLLENLLLDGAAVSGKTDTLLQGDPRVAEFFAESSSPAIEKGAS
jgi:hypothetical protein